MPTAAKPNLRIVYLLELGRTGELECSAHATTLMKWDAFNPEPIKFEGLFGKRYAGSLTEADRKLALRLRMNCKARFPEVAVLSGAEGHDLLHALLETGRAFWTKGSRLRLKWDEAALPVRLDWRVVLDEYRPTLVPARNDAVLLPLTPPLHVLPQSNQCGPVAGPVRDELLGRWAAAGAMDADAARNFCLGLLNRHPGQTFPIPDAIRVEEAESVKIVPELTLSRRATSARTTCGAAADLHDMVLLELHFRYGKRRIERNSELDQVSYTEADAVLRMPRDRDFEQNCVDRIEALGFRPAPSRNTGELLSLDAGGYLLSPKAPTSWEELLNQVLPELEAEGWKLRYAPGFRLNTTREPELYAEARPEQSWFEYSVGVRYQGMRFSVVEVLRDFIRTSRSEDLAGMLRELDRRNLALPLEDGEFLVLPGKLLKNVLAEVFELLGQTAADGTVRLSRWRTAELAARGLLDGEFERAPDLPDMEALVRRLEGGLALPPLPPPAGLRAELRRYQQDGLAWLQFLRETGTHGILADDMGLGKTLQTIACLALEAEAGRLHGPSLVVAPTSVLDNWQSEIERFAPRLATRTYHGNDRSTLLDHLPAHAIVLTTYAVLRNDIDRLAEIPWCYLVVDEAQFIKNTASLSARSLCRLNARHKLCLTGTPIENRLSELWSLFHFLMPDFLGPHRLFHQSYARAIESGSPDGRVLAARLRKRISPFLLRRKKELVAAELPDKTEIIRPVELLPVQAERYEAVRAAMNRKVAEELHNRGLAGSRIVVLDALLKLRQICCDPRLHTQGPTESPAGSAKLDAAMELVDSLLEDGHRILLFSQFTSMLALIEAELERRGHAYRSLTGATRNRGELVQAFQDGEFPLFLISLKAGGTGLNLTAADAVIHYDPWWNPAAEAQATDRAHRIGQDQAVFVFKLIAENTVEAKILELQKKKGRLAASLLDDEAAAADTGFTEDEILGLFES